jgi:hypothetical protein
MKKPITLESLRANLKFALDNIDSPNNNHTAPCNCSDLGFYKLGFSPDRSITLFEWIGKNDDDTDRYGEAVSASNYHAAYIKVLELLISRYEQQDK